VTIASAADTVGVAAARLYVAYGVFLLAGTLLGVHALVLLISANWLRASPRLRLPVLQWSVDLAYGFLNPLVYLVVILANGPSWLRFPTIRTPLTILAWTLFIIVWTIRLAGTPRLLSTPAGRQWVRALAVAAALVVLAHGALDFVLFVFPIVKAAPPRPTISDWVRPVLSFTVLPASIASLYLIPVLRIIAWIRELSPRKIGTAAEQLLLPARGRLLVRAAVLSAVVIVIASTAPRWSDRHAHDVIREHRDDIVHAAQRYGVDARTLAAIMWVTQRDQLSPLRDALERASMAAWQWDATSDFLLGRPLNISVGVMQVKPLTVQEAAFLRDRGLFLVPGRPTPAGGPEAWSADFKERRDVRVPDAGWPLTGDALVRLTPPFDVPATKPSVVAALLDDRHNIEASALILALCQMQWEGADPAWSIRNRPDILATLYQIGFERSRPHATPEPNRFGRRVREVYDSDWVREMFPHASAKAEAHVLRR
jgi:hypothetical protein